MSVPVKLRLPASPRPIRCRMCLRKLTVFGFIVSCGRPNWKCRRCAIRRAIELGTPASWIPRRL